MTVMIVGGEVFANIGLLIAVYFLYCVRFIVFLKLFVRALHCIYLAFRLQLLNKLELSWVWVELSWKGLSSLLRRV